MTKSNVSNFRNMLSKTSEMNKDFLNNEENVFKELYEQKETS